MGKLTCGKFPSSIFPVSGALFPHSLEMIMKHYAILAGIALAAAMLGVATASYVAKKNAAATSAS